MNAEITPGGGLQEGFIAVPGGKVWYSIAGAAGVRTPLLVLHGGPGVPHDYLEPLEALADERPVVFYDQLGCGNSDKPADPRLWTLERFVDELVEVRRALDLGKVHILGHSWGSMLAVEYLLTRKPAGVASAIFSGPCLSAFRFGADQREYLADLPESMRGVIQEAEAAGSFESQEYQEAVMAYYRLHVCRLRPWPECLNRSLEKLGQEVYSSMWGASEFTLTGTLKDYDRTEGLNEIKLPVLFSCGRHDESTPATTSFYRKMLPGSELVIFEDASHMHHLEKPKEYLKAVRAFLGRVEFEGI